MPRRFQSGSGGLTFHVVNRGARRLRLFDDLEDYLIFSRCVAEALEIVDLDLFAFCVMPNHFHLVVRPKEDPDLTHFMRVMTLRHCKRWHRRRGTRGGGAVYQGRFRAFPIDTESYFYAACRYVEANPLRAGIVARAEDWPWSSLYQRVRNCQILKLSNWPILQPGHWTQLVNTEQNHDEIGQLRKSARSNLPFGEPAWTLATATLLGTARSLRRSGPRPRVPAELKSGINSSN